MKMGVGVRTMAATVPLPQDVELDNRPENLFMI